MKKDTSQRNPALSIVIVSFNTEKLLFECLTSVFLELKKRESVSTEVIVVDNASKDRSFEMVKKNFPEVMTIVNHENVGFAAANNQGIEKSKGEYILLLNSDTKLTSGSLNCLITPLKNDTTIGVVGGKLLNRDNSIQPSIGFLPTIFRVFLWMFFLDDIPFIQKIFHPYHITDKKEYERNQFVDWVSGACFCIRADIISKIGLLDTTIFMYGEEVEWCYRIKKQGYTVLFMSQAAIYHLKGGSGNGTDSGIIEEFNSLLYIYKKHESKAAQRILTLLLSMGALLRIVVFGIIGRYPRRITLYAKAFQLVRR